MFGIFRAGDITSSILGQEEGRRGHLGLDTVALIVKIFAFPCMIKKPML